MQKIEGGVTAAKGFLAAGCAAGIKKENRKDMAMVYSKVPCVTAGTFTTNLVKAAPVKWDQHIVYDGQTAQAIVVNSGIANACTGREGYAYCEQTAQAAADALHVARESVLVASTGVIGQQLPMDRITAGVRTLSGLLDESAEAGHLAAQCIMTTDTVPKEIAVSLELGGKCVTIGGMCKGSGMIHPNMCTMLCFLTTDAAIAKPLLQKALGTVVPDTFNMVSVDGDTSTNDTVLLLANGLAENPEITSEDGDYQAFVEALLAVTTFFARQIAADGEGATALFEAKITGAANKEQAVVLAKSMITSNLSKAAIFGHDANCGRFICAMGYSGASFDPDRVDLYFESAAGKVKVVEDGAALACDEELATKILSEKEVTVRADLKMGDAEATAWGCDLTYEYVTINADYRS